MDIQGRLRIFFDRLTAAPPTSSANEALALVCRLIEEVEDEFCPIPRENPPPYLRFTGRMYAPQSDRIFRLDDGSILAETRRHMIYCGRNGDIQIENADEESIVFKKPGK